MAHPCFSVPVREVTTLAPRHLKARKSLWPYPSPIHNTKEGLTIRAVSKKRMKQRGYLESSAKKKDNKQNSIFP